MDDIFFLKEYNNQNCEAHIIFICDHASNHIPEEYANLGLSKENLESHIAYDIGAKRITKELAKKLGQTSFFSNFSRLLVDPNRNENDPDIIVSNSFGIDIPGNLKLDNLQKKERLKIFHQTYHVNLTKIIKKKIDKFKKIILISIHSYTKEAINLNRGMEVGLLWNRNMNILLPVQKKLLKKKMHVGRNYPYSGFFYNYTLDRHSKNGLIDNLSIEIRNDLICSEKGIKKYVEIFENLFQEILND
jgi:predicted N-formylglutamate amidohydrolase